MPYCIVRTYSAGVFAGYIKSKSENCRVVVINKARRLHRWAGAASLSQMAQEGTSKPEACRFPIEMDEITVPEAIEIIQCTEQARLSIASVPIWSA
ncbi:MAG: DUF6948 domain-containing protein [Candidatus Thorarchaeota archaeon]